MRSPGLDSVRSSSISRQLPSSISRQLRPSRPKSSQGPNRYHDRCFRRLRRVTHTQTPQTKAALNETPSSSGGAWGPLRRGSTGAEEPHPVSNPGRMIGSSRLQCVSRMCRSIVSRSMPTPQKHRDQPLSSCVGRRQPNAHICSFHAQNARCFRHAS